MAQISVDMIIDNEFLHHQPHTRLFEALDEVVNSILLPILNSNALSLPPLLSSILSSTNNNFEQFIIESFSLAPPYEYPGTDAEQLAQLGPYTRFKSTDKEILENVACTICLENFKIGEGKRMLPCSHIFHKKCIDRWIKYNKPECCLCRQNPFEKKN